MTRPNDYYPNDHWVISDMDGGKRLRSECKFGVDTERGLLMGEDEWSPVQPQTNITSPTENLSVRDARPRPPVVYAPGQGPGEKRAVPWVNTAPTAPTAPTGETYTLQESAELI